MPIASVTAVDPAIQYLLDGDPAIRWQALHDLTDADAAEIRQERARVAHEGWGARLLAEQANDGRWDGGTYRPGWADEERPFFDAWTATHFSLQQLMDFGVDPDDPLVRTAIARVRENAQWENAGQPYFEGETEPCINGVALAIASYFGEDGSAIATTLLETQLPDGGWNCWAEDATATASFHSTLCVLEGLRAWEQARSGPDAVAVARRAGEEILLERSLLRRRSTGELIEPRFTMNSYPTRWYYDSLRALDYFRLARPEGEPRCAEAVELLRAKRLPMGLWRLELTHEGPTLFDMEAEHEGFPSRWISLRALRVLRWADAVGL